MAETNALINNLACKFLDKIREQGIKIESAYLFGSYAKGKENKWSDIDIAIISQDFTEDRFQERVRLTEISYEIDSRIEPVPFRPENFVDEDPLAYEIKRSGLPLI
jgi:predicted nucleotidyltransferase